MFTHEAQLCPSHGAPLFNLPVGSGWWVCRHCLENSCEDCEEPVTLCRCRIDEVYSE